MTTTPNAPSDPTGAARRTQRRAALPPVGLKPGDEGAPALALQRFLMRFGYLRPDTDRTAPATAPEGVLSSAPDAALVEPPPTRSVEAEAPRFTAQGRFDEPTKTALERYQRFHGLGCSGTVDAATAEMMRMPRCGVPDRPIERTGGRYAAQGSKWPKTALTWRLASFTPDLGEAATRQAIEAAFAVWSAVTPLRFTAVAKGEDIEIRFVSGAHGDGDAFDGPGNVLAHAYFPPPGGGPLAGDAHFDDAERWTVQLPVPTGGIDLVTVAAHEFGHSLGLAHSDVRGALMFPTYAGALRKLAADDVAGIRALYGARAGSGGLSDDGGGIGDVSG